MKALHPLTITIVTETVQDLMNKAATYILAEYTCHEIADSVYIRLQEQYDWAYQDAIDQATAVRQVLKELGHSFCDERGIERHCSFIVNHVGKEKWNWDAESRINHAFCRTAVHVLRLDWLLHLQQDLRG